MEEELTLLACSLLGAEMDLFMSLSEITSAGLWPFSVYIHFFPWRKWWRDYAPVFLGIITGFSRSTLRTWGVDWECRSQGWEGQRQCTLLFSCLKEGASAALAGFWPLLSHPGLANVRSSQKVHTDHMGGMGKGICQKESIGKRWAHQWYQGFLLLHLPFLPYFCFVCYLCIFLYDISCCFPKETILTEVS